LAKHVRDPIHFLGGERTEPPHEVSYADGLDLLEVERSGLKEWFGDVQLPTVVFDRGSMRQDRDHRQLVIGGIIGQEQTRAHFARNAHVYLPDITALRSGHRPLAPLPFFRAWRSLRGQCGRKALYRHARIPSRSHAGTAHVVPDAQARKLVDDLA
jgi:hypothetical protein